MVYVELTNVLLDLDMIVMMMFVTFLMTSVTIIHGVCGADQCITGPGHDDDDVSNLPDDQCSASVTIHSVCANVNIYLLH